MPEAQSKLENLGSFVFRFPDVSCVSRGCSLTRKDSSREGLPSSGACNLFFKAWWTAEGLYHSGLDANSRKEKLHDLLATRLQNSGGNLQEASRHAEIATSLNPAYWHAHATRGQLR